MGQGSEEEMKYSLDKYRDSKEFFRLFGIEVFPWQLLKLAAMERDSRSVCRKNGKHMFHVEHEEGKR